MEKIDHRPDCQLGLLEVPGLCTCDFDQRMRLAQRFKDADKRVSLDEMNRFATPGFEE